MQADAVGNQPVRTSNAHLYGSIAVLLGANSIVLWKAAQGSWDIKQVIAYGLVELVIVACFSMIKVMLYARYTNHGWLAAGLRFLPRALFLLVLVQFWALALCNILNKGAHLNYFGIDIYRYFFSNAGSMLAAAFLVASHAYSLVMHTLIRQDFQFTGDPANTFVRRYIPVTFVLFGLASIYAHWPATPLLLIAAVKVAADVTAHVWEHHARV